MNKQELLNKHNTDSLIKILFDEPMKNHTTLKIGGPADVMIMPSTEEELIQTIKHIREYNLTQDPPQNLLIMGNGSNMLIRDGGIRGIVVKINDNLSNIRVKGDKIYCQAGALLSTISKIALKNSLKNFEFASGIPGTIGGAITMNAGAYGGEMKDVISMVRVLDTNGNIKEYTNKEMNFRYRNSRIWEEKLIVLGAELQLETGVDSEIEAKMKEFTFNRTSKQPLEFPSAGSTFKRPEGYFAGKLIDDAGLRGLRYGGAQVSEKHCGFIVNIDQAKCSDVLHLISVIQKVVEDKFGVMLEMEIKPLGED